MKRIELHPSSASLGAAVVLTALLAVGWMRPTPAAPAPQVSGSMDPLPGNPFLGQIVMFAGNYAPEGWRMCDGQVALVAQFPALFSILGTTYGGGGRTTFGLPDLRGRFPLHTGSGPGLTTRPLGGKSGQERVTLTESQMPAHRHTLNADNAAADSSAPGDHVLGGGVPIYSRQLPVVSMNTASVGQAGGGQSHDNMPPYTTVNFLIAVEGTFPSRP